MKAKKGRPRTRYGIPNRATAPNRSKKKMREKRTTNPVETTYIKILLTQSNVSWDKLEQRVLHRSDASTALF